MTVRSFLAILLFTLFTGAANAKFWQSGPLTIHELQEKAEAIGKNNIDSVMLLLQRAEEMASRKELQSVLVENNWIKAKSFYGIREYEKAEEYGLKAIELGIANNSYEVLAKTYNLMGVLAKKQGDFDQAIEQYKLSLINGEKFSDSVGISKTLQNMGLLFMGQGMPDSAFEYYQRSIDLKKMLKDTVSLAKTINNLGSYYHQIGRYEKAIEQYKQAISFYEQNEYDPGVAQTFNNIGLAYRSLGYYQLSLSSYLKALRMYQELDLKMNVGNAKYNIASLYDRLYRTEEALDYYSQSLEIYESLDLEVNQAAVFLGMASLYLKSTDPEDALDYLQRAEEIYRKNASEQDLATIQHGYGRAYAQLKEYDKAKTFYYESIQIKKELKDFDDVGNVYNSLAVTNYELGEYSEALKNYEIGLTLAKEYKMPLLVSSSLIGLSEVNAALNHPEIAYDYRLQYETVKDSLDNVEKSKQISELKEIYESEQKDKQITQLELENEVVSARSEANAALADKQYTEKLISIVIAIAILIMALILYVYFRQHLLISKLKVKEEKESHDKAVNQLMSQQQTKTLEAMLEGQEQERKRIAKELHDHFGSLMAAVKVNLTAVANDNFIIPENNDQMKNLSFLVDKACEDIRSLSHAMNVGISENFGLVPALKDLVKSIAQSERIEVQFLPSQMTENLEAAIEITAYRLVQELVSNVLKHAKATKLTIQITCLGDILNLIVEDNGIGFDAAYYLTHSDGMGLKSMKERIEGLHGEFEVDSQEGKGTTVIIDLPVTMEKTLAEA